MLWSPRAYFGEGMPATREAYGAHKARALNRMCHNEEEVLHWLCYHAVAEVQKKKIM